MHHHQSESPPSAPAFSLCYHSLAGTRAAVPGIIPMQLEQQLQRTTWQRKDKLPLRQV